MQVAPQFQLAGLAQVERWVQSRVPGLAKRLTLTTGQAAAMDLAHPQKLFRAPGQGSRGHMAIAPEQFIGAETGKGHPHGVIGGGSGHQKTVKAIDAGLVDGREKSIQA